MAQVMINLKSGASKKHHFFCIFQFVGSMNMVFKFKWTKLIDINGRKWN